MFTGIVEETAQVTQVRATASGRRFWIAARCAAEVKPGDSVALDGICLTAEAMSAAEGTLVLCAMEETLRCTTAGGWRRSTRLHLERAMPAGGRFDGHLVQGHIDGVAAVVRCGRRGRDFILSLRLPQGLRRYVISKGSLAVNGVSLTVGELRGGLCLLYIIPETLVRTLIGSYRAGSKVNLEVDLIAKYVEHLAAGRGAAGLQGEDLR